MSLLLIVLEVIVVLIGIYLTFKDPTDKVVYEERI